LMAAFIVTRWGMRPVFLATATIFGLVFCWVTYWLSRHQPANERPDQTGE
jgi:hypothetical protein